MFKKAVPAFAGLIALALCSGASYAQDHSRGWENGNVVAVTEVHIKDGMFNAYINDLNNVWRKFIEAQKDGGGVVSYSILANATARDGEADLFLIVTYENWAAFDNGPEYFEKLTDEIMGSMDTLRDANIKRGDLRTIGSNYVMQEVVFKK